MLCVKQLKLSLALIFKNRIVKDILVFTFKRLEIWALNLGGNFIPYFNSKILYASL